MQYRIIEVEFLRQLCQEQQEEIDRLNQKLDDINHYLDSLKGGTYDTR